MEVLATAIIPITSPSDILIVARRAAAVRVAGVPDSTSAASVAIARVSRPMLTAWLVATINRLLDGRPPERPRPPGTLFEQGAFGHADATVWARDWYGTSKRVEVARCADAAAAHELADQLNALLERA